jgi:uncharacterized protein (TIGR04222 family)
VGRFFGLTDGEYYLLCGGAIALMWMVVVVCLHISPARPWRWRSPLSPTEAAMALHDDKTALLTALVSLHAAGSIGVEQPGPRLVVTGEMRLTDQSFAAVLHRSIAQCQISTARELARLPQVKDALRTMRTNLRRRGYLERPFRQLLRTRMNWLTFLLCLLGFAFVPKSLLLLLVGLPGLGIAARLAAPRLTPRAARAKRRLELQVKSRTTDAGFIDPLTVAVLGEKSLSKADALLSAAAVPRDALVDPPVEGYWRYAYDAELRRFRRMPA